MQKSTKTRSDFAPREKHRQHCGLVAKKPHTIRAILPAGTCQRIVLHDTRIFVERGEDGGPGLLVALRAFLRQFLKWSVVYHTQANHGLTVISRDSRDKPGAAWSHHHGCQSDPSGSCPCRRRPAKSKPRICSNGLRCAPFVNCGRTTAARSVSRI